MTSPTKNPNPKLTILLNSKHKTLRVFRGFEQLSSSICCRVMTGKSLVWNGHVAFCATFLFLSKIGFLSQNFGSRYAGKPIKCSKDADFSLVSKKIRAKNDLLGWRPGPDKFGQKFENIPTYDPTENLKPKTGFFSTETRRLAESADVWTAL